MYFETFTNVSRPRTECAALLRELYNVHSKKKTCHESAGSSSVSAGKRMGNLCVSDDKCDSVYITTWRLHMPALLIGEDVVLSCV